MRDYGENIGYKLIEKIQIGTQIYSLGYKQDSEISPFVVWSSHYTRPDNYDSGYYTKSKKAAIGQLQKRIHNEASAIIGELQQWKEQQRPNPERGL